MNMVSRIAFVGAALTVSALAIARTDPNSFLNKPANTLPELLAQVKNDDQVASRFMRHFGQSKEQVLDSFSKMKLGRLPSDGVYLVYNVPSWEEVRARALYFRKGTLVWTDQDGTPVIKVSCGNPMVRGTDIGLAAPMPGVQITPVVEVRDLVALQSPETSFVEGVPSVSTPGTPDVAAADVLPTTPDLPPVRRPIVPALILPLTAGLLLGFNRGDTTPIPEPCSLVAVGVGAAAIIARRRRKR